MSRIGKISKGNRTPARRAVLSLAPYFPSLLIFLFAAISFSLGNAQTLSAGRSSAMGAEKTAQNLYIGGRDANRLVLAAERKDLPQTGWGGGNHALPAGDILLCFLSGAAGRGTAAFAGLKSPGCALGFLPRGPPAAA